MPIIELRFQAQCDHCGKMEQTADDVTVPMGWFWIYMHCKSAGLTMVACCPTCAVHVIDRLIEKGVELVRDGQ